MFQKADCEKFKGESDEYLNKINRNTDLETLDREIREGIVTAALRSIPKSKGKIKRKVVPWWDDKCKEQK